MGIGISGFLNHRECLPVVGAGWNSTGVVCAEPWGCRLQNPQIMMLSLMSPAMDVGCKAGLSPLLSKLPPWVFIEIFSLKLKLHQDACLFSWIFFFSDLICILKHRPGFLFNLGTFFPHIEYYYFCYIYFISFLHKTYISTLSPPSTLCALSSISSFLLGMKPRVLQMPGKFSSTDLFPKS